MVTPVNPYIEQAVFEQPIGAPRELDVTLYVTEWDEMWSFIGSKSEQRWLWYILCRNTGRIVAWICGPRSNETLKKLLKSVAHLPIKICHTDDWVSYSSLFPSDYIHIVGKENTWKIERRNLNFRIHLKRLSRKTICFSKNEKIHDKVISMYIERYYYQYGKFSTAAKAA